MPRFQQGRALTPRAVKRAWGYNRPYDPRDLTRQLASPHQIGNVNAAMQSGRIPHFGPESGGSWGPPPPGGWQEGGVLGDQPVPRELWPSSPPLPRFRVMPGHAKKRQPGRRRVLGSLSQPTTRAERPLPGSGGWQEGGQLEDPLYPVESELADESPWYPDEEVGFEEAAPMQGGFDIFGRGGG